MLWLLKLVVDEVLVAGRIELLYPYAGLYGSVVALSAAVDYAQTRLEAGVGRAAGSATCARDLYAPPAAALARLAARPQRRRPDRPSRRRREPAGIADLQLGALAPGRSRQRRFLPRLPAGPELEAHASGAGRGAAAGPGRGPLRAARPPRPPHHPAAGQRLDDAWPRPRSTPCPSSRPSAASRRRPRASPPPPTAPGRPSSASVSIQAMLVLLIDAAASIGTLLLVVVGALEMRAGSLTLGTLAAFIGSVGYLYSPIRGLGRTAARFQRAAAGAQRVASLLDVPSLVQRAADRPAAAAAARPGRVPRRHLRLPARARRPARHRPADRGRRDRGPGRAQRRRQVLAGPAAAAALRPARRYRRDRRPRPARPDPRSRCAGPWPWCSRTPICCAPRSAPTSPMAARTPTRRA